jgi:phosphohistidine phosphatase
MEILLVRHGHAVDEAPGLDDTGRWLSGKGRKAARRVARWLAGKKRRRPVAVWTSPLVRAVQTAEILAYAADLTDGVSARAELMPGRAPADLLEQISRQSGGPVVLNGPEGPVGPVGEPRLRGPLALVGHEPQLSQIARALLGDPSFPELKKAGVLALSWDGTNPATVRFLLDPKGLSVTTTVAVEPPAPVPADDA